MPKNAQAYRTFALTSHASRVMLKILQARLQQYVNWELSDVQAEFRKMVTITWSASWQICMQVRKQQLEVDMEQQTGSK